MGSTTSKYHKFGGWCGGSAVKPKCVNCGYIFKSEYACMCPECGEKGPWHIDYRNSEYNPYHFI